MILNLLATTKMQLTSRNTNTLQASVTNTILSSGIYSTSRNGPVLKIPEPVLFHITHPFERVNFCPIRDANPFFHLMESICMLGAENNIPFLAHFAANMVNYSDDNQTQNAFYGTRLRVKWGDQLDKIIKNLIADPFSRQEVALIWDPVDLTKDTKDKACNVMLMFAVNKSGEVEMTSINRSNDAIWGFVSGANIVHLSFFHEYVALSIGRTMGSWWHFTNNLHVYTDNPKWEKLKGHSGNWNRYDGFSGGDSTLVPMFKGPEEKVKFDQQVTDFLAAAIGTNVWKTGEMLTIPGTYLTFIQDAIAMFNTWQMHKFKKATFEEISRHLRLHVKARDWRDAGTAWMARRYPNALNQNKS